MIETVTAPGEYAPIVPQNGSLEYMVDGGCSLIHKKLMQFDLRTGYLKDWVGFHALVTVACLIRRDRFLARFGLPTKP